MRRCCAARRTALTESARVCGGTLTVEVVEAWNAASTVTTRTSLQWTRRSVVLGHVTMVGRTGRELFHQHAVHRELRTAHRRRI